VAGSDGGKPAAVQRGSPDDKATVAGWKNLPTCHMVSGQDNAIPPDC
jgi:hypothetical protein